MSAILCVLDLINTKDVPEAFGLGSRLGKECRQRVQLSRREVAHAAALLAFVTVTNLHGEQQETVICKER